MRLPESKHFTLQLITAGVYAALHHEGGWGIGNAGIVDLGDKTLIFDTMMTPAAAEDLNRAAVYLGDRPVSHVFNSHYHNDHLWGNQVFEPTAQFISTGRTRELVLTKGREEYRWHKQNSAKIYKELLAQFEAVKDPAKQTQLTTWLTYYRASAKSIALIQVRDPDLTFEDRLVLHGSDRSAVMLAVGSGHTDDDAVLYLPDDGIVFLADLLFIDNHPYLVDGHPEELIRILDRIVGMQPRYVVPGHGPVGTTDDIRVMKEYVTTLMDMALEMVENGETEQAVEDKLIPEPYEDWGFPNFFRDNLLFLTNQIRSRHVDQDSS